MKVLHAPAVIANQSVILTKALRELGIEATSLQYYNPPRKYSADININIGRRRNLIKWFFIQLQNFPRLFNNYDIYHFHYARTLLPFFIDLPILKILGKKIIFEYHGADIKPPFSYVISFNVFMKLYVSIHQHIIKIVSKLFVDAEIVTTPDLLKSAPSAQFIPVAVDETNDLKSRLQKKDKIVIVHAPTNRIKKGTSYIIDAVEKLKKEGFDIEFDLVEDLSEKEAKKRYERADIAIDQILIGWYGLFSVEMMSLGKPVVCYVRKDLKKYAPNLPIVSSDKDTLATNLKILTKDKKLREKLGEEGKKFVAENHDSIKIAKKLIELYKSL